MGEDYVLWAVVLWNRQMLLILRPIACHNQSPLVQSHETQKMRLVNLTQPPHDPVLLPLSRDERLVRDSISHGQCCSGEHCKLLVPPPEIPHSLVVSSLAFHGLPFQSLESLCRNFIKSVWSFNASRASVPTESGTYSWAHFWKVTRIFLVDSKVGWDYWHVGEGYQGRLACCNEGGVETISSEVCIGKKIW